MSPKEHCERCRKWILQEAQNLDDETRQKVVRALEEKNEALCCLGIHKLRETGCVPASWDEVLREWWDFAR